MPTEDRNPAARPAAQRPPSQQYDIAEAMRLLAARQRAVNVPVLMAAMDAGNPGEVHAELDRVAGVGQLVNASETLRTLLTLSAVAPAERAWFDPRRLIAFTVKLHEGGDVDGTRVSAAQDLQRALEAWFKSIEGQDRAALGRGFTERLVYCGQLARLDATFPAELRDAIAHAIIRGEVPSALAAMERLIAKNPKQAEIALYQMEREAPRLYREFAPLSERATASAAKAYRRVEVLGLPPLFWAFILAALAGLAWLAWPSDDAEPSEDPDAALLSEAADAVCAGAGRDGDTCRWATRAADALRTHRCPLAQEMVERMEAALAVDSAAVSASAQPAVAAAAAKLSADLVERCP
jgi:hypothetical protein